MNEALVLQTQARDETVSAGRSQEERQKHPLSSEDGGLEEETK